MATRGRKPVPTHLALVQGRPAHKLPKPAQQISPPVEEVAAPEHLSPEAKAEWHRVIGVLVILKLISQLDRAALGAYCQAYGRWVQAERALEAAGKKKDALANGLVIDTSRGNYIQNPLVGIANKAMLDMMRYATEFGMTPSARTRLQPHGSGANENPFEAFRKSAS